MSWILCGSLEDGHNLTLTPRRRHRRDLNWKVSANYFLVVITLTGEIGVLTNFLSTLCKLQVFSYSLGKNYAANLCGVLKVSTKAWGAGSPQWDPEVGDITVVAINSGKTESSGGFVSVNIPCWSSEATEVQGNLKEHGYHSVGLILKAPSAMTDPEITEASKEAAMVCRISFSSGIPEKVI